MFAMTYVYIWHGFSIIKGPLRGDKNCKADCISNRLAGYWEKFSISNNRASDEPHWLR